MQKGIKELHQEIIRQQTYSKILDQQIDIQQSNATKLLKDAIIEKHFYVVRRFITESFQANALSNPLALSGFTHEREVAANFASLDLPDTF